MDDTGNIRHLCKFQNENIKTIYRYGTTIRNSPLCNSRALV